MSHAATHRHQAHRKSLEPLIAKSTVLQAATPTRNPFSSFYFLPEGLGFDVQHSDEHILLFLRQHFIVNTGWIVLAVFLGFLPSLTGLFPMLGFLPVSFVRILFLAWYLFLFGFVLERFSVWYYNVYIVTDERLIDVDFYSLLFKRVSEAKLEHVQDMTGASGGVVQSVFDYGDVTVQTAAEVPEIEFERVPHPDIVMKLISELIDRDKEEEKRK